MSKKRTKLYLALFVAVILTATAVLALAQSTQDNKPKDPFESTLDGELQTTITLNDEYMPQKKYTLIIGPNAALPEDPADGAEPVDSGTPSETETLDPGTPSDAVKPSVQAWRCDVGDTHRLALKALKYYYKTDATYTLTYDSAWLELLGTDTQYSTGELKEISNEPGELVFTYSKEIPEGQTWTGLIALLNFKILQTGTTEVILQLDKEQPLPASDEANRPDVNVNLVDKAHRKSVAASTEWSSGYIAEYALEKGTSNRWASAAYASDPAILTVEFKRDYTFNYVYLKEFDNFVASYQLQYLKPDTTDEWETFFTGTSLGTKVIEDFGNINASAIRVVLYKTSGLLAISLYEFQVRYIPIPDVMPINSQDANINLVSKTYRDSVIASSEWSSDYIGEYALEEGTAKRWAPAAYAPDPAILTVKFKGTYTFNYIYLKEYNDYVASYQLQYLKPSTTNTWITFYTGTSLGTKVIEDFGQISTAAVRVVLYRTSGSLAISLYEFQVRYMPTPDITPINSQDENINLVSEAYRDGVIASSVWSSEYTGAYALEEGTAKRWASAAYAIDPAILTVQFKGVYTFNHIYLKEFDNFVANYQLQYLKPSTTNTWITFHTGTALGTKNIEDFGEIDASAVRILLYRASGSLAISLYEFQVRYN